MRIIEINCGRWKSIEDFYAAILSAIGAPEWHGRSIDALEDSMVWHDDINALKAPYRLRLLGISGTPLDVRSYIENFAQAINKAGASDAETELEISVDIVG